MTEDDSARIIVQDDGGVRILIFCRPEARNALSRAMRRRLAELLAEADRDPSVHCIILTGTGGVFTAGSDIRESRAQPGPLVRPHPAEAIRALRTPIIAAVDGPCVTGGLEIALSCSFIIASDRATFADTHAKIGIFPAWGQSALLPRAIGMRRARHMMLTGDFIDAPTACAWGIANELVPSDQLMARCLALAALIAACDARSVQWQMQALHDQDGIALDRALAQEEFVQERWRAGNKDYVAMPDGCADKDDQIGALTICQR